MALDVSKAVYSRLSGYAALTALVGTKIAPMEAPQSWQLPYVTYMIIADPPTHAMLRDASIGNPSLRISAWAETYSSVRGVADAVRAALRDYQGTITVSSTSLVVQRIFYEDRIEIKEIHESPTNVDDVVYHISQDFIIWHD